MSFWSKLFGGKKKKGEKKKRIPARIEGKFILFSIKCDKCGEEITIRVNRQADIQSLYTEAGEKEAFYNLKKEILGKKCPNLINIDVDFDRGYRIISQKISGGKFITPEK